MPRPIPATSRAIRAWRASTPSSELGTTRSERSTALLTAYLAAARTDLPAMDHLRRALRTERRLARQGDRRYDIDRHAALARACAALDARRSEP